MTLCVLPGNPIGAKRETRGATRLVAPENDETKAVLDERMTPEYVVFMHLPPDPEKISQIEARVLQTFPNAVVFVTPMETKAL